MIYFVQTNDNAHIKIGYASNVEKRMAALQTGAPRGVKLLATMPGDKQVERAVHERFARLRGHGEWFDTDRAIIELAMQAALLDGLADNDPFLRYAVLEPALIALYIRAAATVDDDPDYFCANDVFFGHHRPIDASLKRQVSKLVGWYADPFRHSDLRTQEAYDVVYDRIYNALPDCRNCRCFPSGTLNAIIRGTL